ncbi:uncharacterized protein [Panulirus ornatus]|uniref:uncharacterized protein n=1 Tax=Panulirus ornatus TaxID=150431 RepID=UPI003A861168
MAGCGTWWQDVYEQHLVAKCQRTTPCDRMLESNTWWQDVDKLQAGQTYDLVITAINDKGPSAAIYITITSGSVYQSHDGPSEAEVRDGSKNGGNLGNVMSGGGSTGGKNKYLSMLSMPSLVPATLGTMVGLILIIIVLILLITLRTRIPHHLQAQQDIPCQEIEAEGTSQHNYRSPSISNHISCLERDMQVESDSEADPDVIPFQEGSSSPTLGPSPAFIMPPEQYNYATVPARMTISVDMASFLYTAGATQKGFLWWLQWKVPEEVTVSTVSAAIQREPNLLRGHSCRSATRGILCGSSGDVSRLLRRIQL